MKFYSAFLISLVSLVFAPSPSRASDAGAALGRALLVEKDFLRAREFTPQYLRDLKKRQGVRKIADFLPLLPRDLRTRFTGFKESYSLQNATEKNPRIIMFSYAGDLVFAFNGSPSQQGYDSIEILSFNWDKLEFELERIVFEDDEVDRLQWLANEKARLDRENIQDWRRRNLNDEIQTAQALQLLPSEKKNPAVCMGCHSFQSAKVINNELVYRDPQPNWHHYPYWPYTLRPVQDGLTLIHPTFGDLIRRGAVSTPRLPSDTHPRYRHLEWDVEALNQSNNLLTSRLYFLNMLRVFRITSSHPDFDKFKYEFVGAALKCDFVFAGLNQKAQNEALRKKNIQEASKVKVGSLYAFALAQGVLEKYGFSPRIINLSPHIGDGNNFTTPNTIALEIAWVFLQEEFQSGQFPHAEISGRYRLYAPHINNIRCGDLQPK